MRLLLIIRSFYVFPVSTAPVPFNQARKVSVDGFCQEWDEREVKSFVPGSSCYLKLEFFNGHIVYRALMHFDEQGRRVVPWKGKEKRHLIILGGSFAFGQGLSDEESLAAKIGQLTRTTRPYNLALVGGGPNDVYAQFPGSLMGIPKTPGTAIYVGITNHVDRLFGTTRTLGTWADHRVAIQEVKQGQFRVLGSWKKARPYYTRMIKLLASSGFVQYFNISIPPITEEHIAGYVRLIVAIKAEYLAHFPQGKFIYVFPAGEEFKYSVLSFKREFDKQGISYIDYSDLCPSALTGPESPLIPGDDRHPSAAYSREWAKILVRDLEIVQ